MCQKYDKDGSGSIEFDEFYLMIGELNKKKYKKVCMCACLGKYIHAIMIFDTYIHTYTHTHTYVFYLMIGDLNKKKYKKV